MAIAFGAATNGGNTTGTSLSFAHTCTGADRILVVGCYRVEQPITGVTYAGIAMAQVDFVQDTPAGNTSNLFMLVNPASGANNVIISTGASSYIGGNAASYSGAAQSSQPDAHITNNDSTNTDTLSTALTPLAGNCWIVMHKESDQLIATTIGCVSRVVNTDGRIALLDTNGAISPPASTTLTFTTTFFGTQHTAILASFSEPGGIHSSLRMGHRSWRRRAGWSVSSPGGFF
jgi:hypothetical protein